jgi:hypothetical protein
MNQLFATFRLVAAIAALVAVAATYVTSIPTNFFNFFGYFTMQSNLLCVVVFAWAAYVGFRGGHQSSTLVFLRACATTYIVLVGAVYNTLLTGLGGGVALPWANDILHIVIPIYASVDWILFADRTAIPWRKFWLVLIYPIVWTVVVLIRGATDGWVPYPFLDPSQGYGTVTIYCVAIAVGFAVFGLAVWALSRVRILRP